LPHLGLCDGTEDSHNTMITTILDDQARAVNDINQPYASKAVDPHIQLSFAEDHIFTPTSK
jgi:hypothetical protein